SPAIFSFHTHYGILMECPWNGAFHMDSMDWSMWIPRNFNELQLQIMYHSIRIPWNSPHGFHGIPWESPINCVVKNSGNSKN
ncbi:hypothetical protein K443DRAFT_99618, partial [Laccaria amethystina LaAM-08-1]